MITRRFALLLVPCGVALAACGNAAAPSPFIEDAGKDAPADAPSEAGGGGAGGGLILGDAGSDAATYLGGPCVDDGECNDNIACTFDTCDTAIGRCKNIPDDSKCQDGIYCNGMELCQPPLGCVAGVPIVCSKDNPCNIGTCVEASQSCAFAIKDADGDGDGDWHCDGGHDCNDYDPNVNSHTPEVCSNGIDDNCNHLIDEHPCVSPANTTCLDPLQITKSGTYPMTTVGAGYMYPISCSLAAGSGLSEVVAAVVLPAGPAMDVEITAESPYAGIAVAIDGTCGEPSTEITCGGTYQSESGGQIARVRGRALGGMATTTAYPVFVQTSSGLAISLDVQFLPVTPAPTNLTCGTALPITLTTPATPITSEILDEPTNLGTACTTGLGQLVYSFTLASPSDVTIYAGSTDGMGQPVVSLRDSGCALPTDEISCLQGDPLRLYREDLAAGTYYIAVSATAPTGFQLTVEVSAPTTPAPDQFCAGAPVITPNVTIPVSLSANEDGENLGCLAGAVDGAYELDLPVASDVLLVERIAQGDTGSVGLATPACTPASALLCNQGGQSPVRGSVRNIAAGQYRVVAESLLAEDVELTAFVRPAVPPTLVTFAAGCSQANPIPATGGFFQGNTANSTANFPAGCDLGTITGNGAPDQLLSLTLTSTQRVVFDMEGSGYNTILDIRQGPSCPGVEIANACAVGYPPWHSYLDLTLDAGTYFVQVDGYDGASGPWFLDVRVVDP